MPVACDYRDNGNGDVSLVTLQVSIIIMAKIITQIIKIIFNKSEYSNDKMIINFNTINVNRTLVRTVAMISPIQPASTLIKNSQ